MTTATTTQQCANGDNHHNQEQKEGEGDESGDVSFMCYCCGTIKIGDGVLRACSRCCFARYCSEQCQRDHWKLHKPFCKMMTENQSQANEVGQKREYRLFTLWCEQATRSLSQFCQYYQDLTIKGPITLDNAYDRLKDAPFEEIEDFIMKTEKNFTKDQKVNLPVEKATKAAGSDKDRNEEKQQEELTTTKSSSSSDSGAKSNPSQVPRYPPNFREKPEQSNDVDPEKHYFQVIIDFNYNDKNFQPVSTAMIRYNENNVNNNKNKNCNNKSNNKDNNNKKGNNNKNTTIIKSSKAFGVKAIPEKHKRIFGVLVRYRNYQLMVPIEIPSTERIAVSKAILSHKFKPDSTGICPPNDPKRIQHQREYYTDHPDEFVQECLYSLCSFDKIELKSSIFDSWGDQVQGLTESNTAICTRFVVHHNTFKNFLVYALHFPWKRPRYKTHTVIVEATLTRGLGQVGSFTNYLVDPKDIALKLFQKFSIPGQQQYSIPLSRLDVEEMPEYYKIPVLVFIKNCNNRLLHVKVFKKNLPNRSKPLPAHKCDRVAASTFEEINELIPKAIPKPDLNISKSMLNKTDEEKLVDTANALGIDKEEFIRIRQAGADAILKDYEY